ncbi:hypothetical protein U1Q18_045679, partial [Sarracenia purpurea var. burkii]
MNTPMKIARVPRMRRETASAISLIGGLLFQVVSGCVRKIQLLEEEGKSAEKGRDG